MKTSLTKIGNSKGVIIPSQMIKQCQFDDMVDIEIKDNNIVISKIKNQRDDWVHAFAPNNDELLCNDAISNQFDDEEWEW